VSSTSKERNNSDRSLWQKTLRACQECLEMDRKFMKELDRKKEADNQEGLEPVLWENFIEARRDLMNFTSESINILARDQESQNSNSDIKDRLITSLDEMMSLEEKLAAYLSENLDLLKETIEDLTKNQAIFSSYGRQGAKSCPDIISSRT
jgi:hypothetical protein